MKKKVILYLSIMLVTICCKFIKHNVPNKTITIKGWIVDERKIPLDSVEILNFKNEIITYSNKEGFFEMKNDIRIFHQYIFFQKERYLKDTIKYYTYSDWRGGWLLYSGLDTIVLKRKH